MLEDDGVGGSVPPPRLGAQRAPCVSCVRECGGTGVVCVGLVPLSQITLRVSGGLCTFALSRPHTARLHSFQGSVDLLQLVCETQLKSLLPSSFPLFQGDGKG